VLFNALQCTQQQQASNKRRKIAYTNGSFCHFLKQHYCWCRVHAAVAAAVECWSQLCSLVCYVAMLQHIVSMQRSKMHTSAQHEPTKIRMYQQQQQQQVVKKHTLEFILLILSENMCTHSALIMHMILV
jgi:hypothetical protein